jgi:hypothetical protein
MDVMHTPAQFAPVAAVAPPATVAQATEILFDTGYVRTLKAGSQWQRAGTIAEGDVYRPYNDVFMVEGAHIHEAWLVVAGGMLTGFYLPAERGFTPLSRRIAIPLSPTPPQKEQ